MNTGSGKKTLTHGNSIEKSRGAGLLFIFALAQFAWWGCQPGVESDASSGALAIFSSTDLERSFKDSSVTEVFLANDIALTKNLALTHDIVIHGKDKTMDLGAFKLDAGSHGLTLADTLKIQAEDLESGATITGTGKFVVEEGANIRIRRALGKHKSHLMDGFSEYLFKKGATFFAQAGTNQKESTDGTVQTGVIRSLLAKSFVVEKDAKVTLVSDASSAKADEHGSCALILRKPKGGELHIEVQENATLALSASGLAHNLAPVMILHESAQGNVGVSRTFIRGTLNVTSNNGNGWHYLHSDAGTDSSDAFTVDAGKVNIYAKVGSSADKTKGAAFESSGRNPTYIRVENGGFLNVDGSGARGMSLAGGNSFAEKSMVVKGKGSKLRIYGHRWAIAAEAQPTLSISAVRGGEILLENSVENAALSGSTAYSTGPTTYQVDGSNSKMELIHHGGDDGAVLADGRGALKISVTRGANMSVYSKNSGSNLAARKAAICAQSGTGSIVVEGRGSVLEVVKDSPEKADNASVFPQSAVAFASQASGSIVVRKGGSFLARNNNADSPAIVLGSNGTDKGLGKLIIDNPKKVEIQNDADSGSSLAVALSSANAQGNALEVQNAHLTAWPIGSGAQDWPDEDSIDRWYIGAEPFTAQSHGAVSTPFTGNKGSRNFQLSGYGRLALEGTTAEDEIVTRVEINEKVVKTPLNKPRQLSATVHPEWAKNKVVEWTSSDPSVATVDAKGLVTPLQLGVTTITATSTDGSDKSDDCRVEISPIPVESIQLSPSKGFVVKSSGQGIEVGKEAELVARVFPDIAHNKSLIWSSSDESVLSVAPSELSKLYNGLNALLPTENVATTQKVRLKALKASNKKVRITAKAADGNGAEASYEVGIYTIPVQHISLNKFSAKVEVDKTVQLKATVYPSAATNKALWWRTSDSKVATVDPNGLVKALRPGQATIYATTSDGSWIEAGCTVIVPPAIYTVLIKTGDKYLAGTNANIHIKLRGASGRESKLIYLNSRIDGNEFERNDLDVVTLSHNALGSWEAKQWDLGLIQGIEITSDNKGSGAGWYLEYVHVIRNGKDVSKFTFNQWVEKGNLKPTKSEPSSTKNISGNKPIYLIGHRANNSGDIYRAIQRGANAVECDIQYNKSDGKFYVNHDVAKGLTLDDWLNEAAAVADKYGDMFALVYFDVKDSDYFLRFINTVHAHEEFSKKNLNIIYSVAKLKEAEKKFATAYSMLYPNEGLNIDFDNRVARIAGFYKNNGIMRAWYGNGINAGVPINTILAPNVVPDLIRANEYRGAEVGQFKKTISWTYEKKDSVQMILSRHWQVKADAIMVNFGGGITGNHMKDVLEGFYELPGLRLATRKDNPFEYNPAWY